MKFTIKDAGYNLSGSPVVLVGYVRSDGSWIDKPIEVSIGELHSEFFRAYEELCGEVDPVELTDESVRRGEEIKKPITDEGKKILLDKAKYFRGEG